MTDDPDDARLSEVANPNTGIRMLEADSHERLVDGLKVAAEGCRNLTVYTEDRRFETAAHMLDKLRENCVATLGRERPGDRAPTNPVTGKPKMTRIEAYNSVYVGLTEAARTARQFATGHRGDLRWTVYAGRFEDMRDRVGLLVRKKTLTSDFIIT